MLKALLTFLTSTWIAVSPCTSAATGKIAIIIDDVGYRVQDKNLLSLPTSISFAILPFTPFSKKIAHLAHQQNREILLHLPMEAYINNHLLGEGALTQAMTKQELQQTLRKNLSEIPQAIGVNNHMGSKLTEQASAMQWTMELLFQHGIFYVDSRTSANSLAESNAISAGLPALKRHVFLDNIKTPEAMEKQFQVAITHSLEESYTIIIAHPYPETLQFLSQRLTQHNENFQLVPLTTLIPEKQRVLLEQKKVQYQQTNLISSKRNNI